VDKRTYSEMLVDHLEHQRRAAQNAQHESRLVIEHYQSPLIAIVVLFLQSAITAFLLAILTMIAAVHFFGWVWFQVMGISFIVYLLGDWLRRCGAWSCSVGSLERALMIDINADGMIGLEPDSEPIKETVEITVFNETTGRKQWVDFPVSRSKICEMASDIFHGSGFSESSMSGAGALFSRAEFNKIRDVMLRRELLQWKNEEHRNQGTEFTVTGWHVLRALAAEHRGVTPEEVKLLGDVPLSHQWD